MEIIETTLAADPVRASEMIVKMSGQGLIFSIDDFGTGYSSLALLRTIPVNKKPVLIKEHLLKIQKRKKNRCWKNMKKNMERSQIVMLRLIEN